VFFILRKARTRTGGSYGHCSGKGKCIAFRREGEKRSLSIKRKGPPETRDSQGKDRYRPTRKKVREKETA